MPAARRPKQRQLIRWNDDLDKSLLLFITHTCTEMGIKIPYDEIARRMGSGFTEGAIQQHIAKLRKQMAELNVAPVPAPPKRGTITTKPSAVYAMKSRARPAAGPPPPPPPQQRRPRSQAVDRSNQPDQSITASRSRRCGARQSLARSESDYGESDDEFAGASDEEFEDEPVDRMNKRKRGGARRTSANTPRRVSATSHQEGDSLTQEIMENLARADAEFEAQNGSTFQAQAPPHQPMYIYNPTQQSGQAMASQYTSQLEFGGIAATGFAEDEEEEEEVLASEIQVGQGAGAGPFSQGEQISPTTTSSVQMPDHSSSFPQLNGQDVGLLNFPGSRQTLLQNTFSSNNHYTSDNSGYGNPDTFMPLAGGTTLDTTIPMGPPAFPSAIRNNMLEYNLSSPSTRHTSFMSQASSQGSSHQPSATSASPMASTTNDCVGGMVSKQPSPPNHVTATTSDAGMTATTAMDDMFDDGSFLPASDAFNDRNWFESVDVGDELFQKPVNFLFG